MNKQEHLFEAIGLVEDRYVEEAADAKRTATPWKKWAAMAACLVLVIGLGASSLMLLFRGCGSANVGYDSTQSVTASDTTEGSDSAATTEDAAGASETDGGSTEESTAADSATTDSATSDSAAPEDGVNTGMESGERTDLAAIGPLTADADGLTATRTVTVSDRFGSLAVYDTYRISSTEAQDTFLYYPAMESNAAHGSVIYSVRVDGAAQAVEMDGQDNLVFPLTLEAGAEVEVTVTVMLPDKDDGTAGFALFTDGGILSLTEQTAELELTDANRTATENSFGLTEGTVALEPPETYRLVLQSE